MHARIPCNCKAIIRTRTIIGFHIQLGPEGDHAGIHRNNAELQLIACMRNISPLRMPARMQSRAFAATCCS